MPVQKRTTARASAEAEAEAEDSGRQERRLIAVLIPLPPFTATGSPARLSIPIGAGQRLPTPPSHIIIFDRFMHMPWAQHSR